MQRLVFFLVIIFTLQPILAMDGDEKRRKIDASAEQDEQQTITSCPPTMLLASKSEHDLFQAMQAGNIERCLWLIDQGVNVNCRDDFANTPLIIAAQHNNHKLVAELLKRGADIHANNDDALWHAVINDYPQTANTLLNHGANINARRNVDKHSFLSRAISCGAFVYCNRLLKYGANPNGQDNHGEPVIIRCINYIRFEEQCYDCLKGLLKYGANPNILHNGTTPLMDAAFLGHLPACELLLQYGANPQSPNYYQEIRQAEKARQILVISIGGDHNKIIALLSDPAKIREVIMREDNPNLPRRNGQCLNICHGIQQRELGEK